MVNVKIIAVLAVVVIAISFIGIEMTGFATAGGETPEEIRFEVFEKIYAAIGKAEEQGLYACCIEPPCTMCFLKGTEHEFTSEGKYCNCDKLIAEGKEPCPQCRQGLCGQADTCTFNNTGG